MTEKYRHFLGIKLTFFCELQRKKESKTIIRPLEDVIDCFF